jgi:hypothetical protein
MSHYGPPGESGRRYPEEYGPPSDPWGAAPAADSWNDYGSAQPPYSSHDPYAEPHHAREMPPPRRNVGLYAVVALLVVLAAGGVGYALYLLSGGDGDTTADGPTPAATTSAGPSGSPAPGGTPRDNIGMNAAMAQVDDCLVNDGTVDDPRMRIVACDAEEDAQVFQVLAIFGDRVEGEGAAANEHAQSICSGTEGYEYHYYEVGDGASFVLCMTDA